MFVRIPSSTGVARDVLRNVTYVLRNNGRIGVVRDGIYSFLFKRSNVESLVVDWVANVLYWIEGGTAVSSESIYVNTYGRCAYACVCVLFLVSFIVPVWVCGCHVNAPLAFTHRS